MTLRGKGALVIWHDVAPEGRAEFEAWHLREHMAERVAVPGFRRGRRYRAIAGRPEVFMLYEVADLTVLTSAPYLTRLNDPTPWTRRALAHFRDVNRTLCRVTASLGSGLGGFAATLQPAPAVANKQGRLAGEVLPTLAARNGIVGVHLLAGDAEASRTETAEKKLRDRPDAVADRVIVVEAANADALSALGDDLPPPVVQNATVYRLVHCLSATDLEA